MWGKTSARASATPNSHQEEWPLEEVQTRGDRRLQPAHQGHFAHASLDRTATKEHPVDSRVSGTQEDHVTPSMHLRPVSDRDSAAAAKIAPPSAKSTDAERRGPSWLVAVLDFLERQLSLASSVEDRISLLRAYTRTLLAVSTIFLMAAVAAIYLLANAHRSSLIILAASGAVTGIGAWIHKARR
jgi:hypothetical protein